MLKWLQQRMTKILNMRVFICFVLFVLSGVMVCSVVSSYENSSKQDDLAKISSGFFVSKGDVDRLQDQVFRGEFRRFLAEKGILTKSSKGLIYYYISEDQIEKIRNPELRWEIKRFVVEPLQRGIFPQKSASRFYEIQPGDTLWNIARDHGMSVDQLRHLNELTPAQPIYPGQKLRVSPDHD